MEPVVSKEQAEKEVNSWIDFQGMSAEDRKKIPGTVNKLINSVMDGTLQIDSTTNVLTQKLKYPFGKDEKVTELIFQPHITVGDVQSNLTGTDPTDQYAEPIAHICASTGQPRAIIHKMNKKDFRLSDSISVFFML